ncbi:MAG: hypothetical protein NZM25_09325 [Leptospiraceae bacterium]|nr:hypothetical protein [Leptospiraceae bacterium]MDW8307340.1 nucleoside transporter C-terminal domain-containing protein [Leptospiraceae bacterium]
MENLIGLLGLTWILAISWFFSEDRGAISYRSVLAGLALQFFLAGTILKGEVLAEFLQNISPSGKVILILIIAQVALVFILRLTPLWKSITKHIRVRTIYYALALEIVYYLLLHNAIGRFFEGLAAGARELLAYSEKGATFVFGPLGSSEKLKELFGPVLGDKIGSFSVLFAFQILPTIIFVASLFAVLYYLHLMQPVVRLLGKAMQKVFRSSGAESLSVAANIFMGQTEAPLTVLPYLGAMTRSELFTIMVSGMSHASAGILLAYAAVAGADPKHLIASVVMASPICIMLSKMWVPEKGTPQTAGGALPRESAGEDKAVNVVDAAARGAQNGLTLAANVAAMLLAFIALIALLNGIWGEVRQFLIWALGNLVGTTVWLEKLPKTLEEILGFLFAPVSYSLGVSWVEALSLGKLLGTRLVLNEFVGYIELGAIREILSEKAFVVATYMLCGFGNISSVAIQVGGLGALIPHRRHELASLGMKAVLVGTLTNLFAAASVGLIL